jgi:nicotinamide riboside kinase
VSPGRRIAIVGAGRTGKTTLAFQLAAYLCGQGLRALAVADGLREWCERAGRSPGAEERLALAREHEERVAAAAADGEMVIADTSALAIAAQAGEPGDEGELRRLAIGRQRDYALTLLTGLDLPLAFDPAAGQAVQGREDADAQLRRWLQGAALPYQVVYGQGPQRLRSAVHALAAAGLLPSGEDDRARHQDRGPRWAWACEKCSDPACEHHLFTQLQDARRGRPSG